MPVEIPFWSTWVFGKAALADNSSAPKKMASNNEYTHRAIEPCLDFLYGLKFASISMCNTMITIAITIWMSEPF